MTNLLLSKIFSFLEKKLEALDYTWGDLSQQIITEIKSHTGVLSSRHLKMLENYVNRLISSTPLQHPQMANYLEELDREQINMPRNAAHLKPYDAPPENAFELCRQMFFSCEARRKLLYQQYLKDFDALGVNDIDKSTMATLLNQPAAIDTEEDDALSEEASTEEDTQIEVKQVVDSLIDSVIKLEEKGLDMHARI